MSSTNKRYMNKPLSSDMAEIEQLLFSFQLCQEEGRLSVNASSCHSAGCSNVKQFSRKYPLLYSVIVYF